MNPRRILAALSLALFVSALCTWFVSRKLNAPVTFEKTRDVLYAAASRDLQAGEVLKADNTELISWPASAPLEGAFARTEDVMGRQALFPFAKGQPFLAHSLSAADAATGLASKIPDGMRAVALRSDEVVGVAGYIVPGSHLDVLVTYRPESAPEPMTAVVLQDALVLADGRQSQGDPQGKLPDVNIVTLLLSLEQAQRAVLASNQGAIHFVLRNGGDGGVSVGGPVLLSQLSGRPSPGTRNPVSPAVQAVAAPKPREIETVLGGAGR